MAAIAPNASKRITEAFSKAEKFAQPICNKLREIIHKADPQIVEDWKWGPGFNRNGLICGIWAFKQHVTINFYRGASMKDNKKLFIKDATPSAFNRLIKFHSIDEVDEKAITAYIKEAVQINLKGIKKTNATISLPADFEKLLKKEKLVKQFEALAYTPRKEFVKWIESAKRPETRQARLKKAVEMIAKKKVL
jgi:hypothetical protein